MIAETFLSYSVRKLRQYGSRIEVALGQLTEEQVWSRPNPAVNSAGNLVLHLCGNIRQWIGYGIAGWPNDRDRDAEFAASGGWTPAELVAKLQHTLDEVVPVIETLEGTALSRRLEIQGYPVTALEAVYHVVEHFSQHTGQILYLTKAMSGKDFGFYSHLSGSGSTATEYVDLTP